MAKKKTEAPGNGSSPVRTTRTAPRRRGAGSAGSNGGNGGPDLFPTHAQIAEAAYLRYLSRGGQDGRDFDDWVEAERGLQSLRAE